MNIGRLNVVRQKSDNASAIYVPTLGCHGAVGENFLTSKKENREQLIV